MLWVHQVEMHLKKSFEIIKNNKIDFSIINGENAADDGKGITQKSQKNFSL